MQKHERDLLREVRTILPKGWTADVDSKPKRHPKRVLTAPDGGSYSISFPRSPSDHLWMENMLAQLKRTIVGHPKAE